MRRCATILIMFLALFASASVRAVVQTRVFLGLNGNDANDCSKPVTPCLSFAGAMAQVGTGGEVIIEATGGYGPLNITKSVTINTAAGVVGFSCCTVTVNAPGGTVVIRGLTIDGAGTSGNGIEVVAVGALHVESCLIQGFSTGFGIHMGAAGALTVKNTDVKGCCFGIQVDNTTGVSTIALDRCHLDGNSCSGFRSLTVSPGSSSTTATSSSANNNGVDGWLCGGGSTGTDTLNLEFCSGSENVGTGLVNDSANSATTAVYSNCVFSNNGIYGVYNQGSGKVQSRTNSTITGNGTAPTFGTITSISGL